MGTAREFSLRLRRNVLSQPAPFLSFPYRRQFCGRWLYTHSRRPAGRPSVRPSPACSREHVSDAAAGDGKHRQRFSISDPAALVLRAPVSLCPDPRPKRWRRQLSTASAGFWLGGQCPLDARGAKKILKI